MFGTNLIVWETELLWLKPAISHREIKNIHVKNVVHMWIWPITCKNTQLTLSPINQSSLRVQNISLHARGISWTWTSVLTLATLPTFYGCQITCWVPWPAVIWNWIVLQGFGGGEIAVRVCSHSQAGLIPLCLHFAISKLLRDADCFFFFFFSCVRALRFCG